MPCGDGQRGDGWVRPSFGAYRAHPPPCSFAGLMWRRGRQVVRRGRSPSTPNGMNDPLRGSEPA
eukprot:648302-Alexandrium_andersonii.AAC.1